MASERVWRPKMVVWWLNDEGQKAVKYSQLKERHRIERQGPNFEFPANRRLQTPAEFDYVFKNNRYRVGCDEFLVLAVANDHLTSRIGIVIGKKTARLAVDRNKIKRLARESFRTSFNKGLFVDIVLIVRPPANNVVKTELMNILKSGWHRLEKKIVAADSNG